MKHLKKIVSLLLTAVMVLAMCIPVMADDAATVATTYMITAPASTTKIEHTYEIYQIFTGTLKNNVLTDVKWGANSSQTKGNKVNDSVMEELEGLNGQSDQTILTALKKYVNLKSSPVKTIKNEESCEVPAGYYLIKDKDDSLDGVADAYTLYIVKIVEDVNFTVKSDVPSMEKKIKDTDDTKGITSDWQDSADYDIGDAVQFKLEGTVAANYDKYNTYYYAFHDIEEAGLTFNKDSVKVYVDDVEIKSNFEVKTNTNTNDGCSFEIVFADLKKIGSVKPNSKIRVEYTSTLNENAALGEQGNLNKAKLEFSNNPNQEQGGTPETGETPWDNVIVFTYKVVINKVNENKDPLTGAEFTLSKKLANGSTVAVAVVKSESGTKFTFNGLDDGEYVLTETKTPDEYNTIEPITFTVNADHTITWDGTNRNSVLTKLVGNKVTGEIILTHNKTEGSLSADVVNKKGSTLPSTGGIGTTIFYVVGVILMLGAGVLLVTKKRMSSNR